MTAEQIYHTGSEIRKQVVETKMCRQGPLADVAPLTSHPADAYRLVYFDLDG